MLFYKRKEEPFNAEVLESIAVMLLSPRIHTSAHFVVDAQLFKTQQMT